MAVGLRHFGSQSLLGALSRSVLTIIVLALAACQSSPLVADQPLQAGETLKLGVLLPESGPYSRAGKPMLSALLQLRDTVNACGGVNQAPISLVIYDAAADRDGGEAGMRYLINEAEVHGVIAAFERSIAVDTLAIALERGVSVLSPTATATITPRRRLPLDGWGQLNLTEVQQARALAKLAIVREWRSARLLVSNTVSGLRFEKAFAQAFTALGGTARSEDTLRYVNPLANRNERLGNPNAAALTAPEIVAALAGADVLVAALDSPQGYQLLTDTLAARAVPTLLADNIALPAFGATRRPVPDSQRPYSLSTVLGISAATTPESLQPLRDRWKQLGLTWGRYTPQAWDAAALFVLAAEAAGRNSRSGIKSKLKAVSNSPGVSVTSVCTGLVHLREGVMINYQGASSSVDLATSGQLVVSDQYDLWRISESGQWAQQDRITLP